MWDRKNIKIDHGEMAKYPFLFVILFIPTKLFNPLNLMWMFEKGGLASSLVARSVMSQLKNKSEQGWCNKKH